MCETVTIPLIPHNEWEIPTGLERDETGWYFCRYYGVRENLPSRIRKLDEYESNFVESVYQSKLKLLFTL